MGVEERGIAPGIIRCPIQVHDAGENSRYSGEFEQGASLLSSYLVPELTSTKRYHILYHLCDTYCELGRPQDGERLVSGTIALLWSQAGQHLKVFQRLGLSLVECYIMQESFDEALHSPKEILQGLPSSDSIDVPDQLGHVRVSLGLARTTISRASGSKQTRHYGRLYSSRKDMIHSLMEILPRHHQAFPFGRKFSASSAESS